MKCVPDEQHKNRWKLLSLEYDQWKQLSEAKIPGLILWRDGQGAWGEISAVAAAVQLLGQGIVPNAWQGIDVDSYDDYGTQLRPYQIAGVNSLRSFFKRASCGLLADDMGLGKTREAIATASTIKGRKLVVCPAAVRLTWHKELANLGYENNVWVVDPYIHSQLKDGKLSGLDCYEWIVTSYDLAAKIFPFVFSSDLPSVLIMDEAHNLRGRGRDGKGNVRTKGLSEIAVFTPYKLAITGTPVWDRPRDLWMLFQLMGITSWKRWDFDVRYCAGRLNQWGGMDNKGTSNTAELKMRLGYYMVRRTKDEVASQLPPLTRTIEWMDPAEEATLAWHHSILTSSGLASALEACHLFKMERAVQLCLQAPSQKFLLATYRKAHAAKLQEMLSAEGVETRCLTGDLSPATRQREVDAARKFQIPIVCTYDSIGVGVDGLQYVADYGVLHAFPWEPNRILQLEARLHRIGQASHVQWVYPALRESAEEHVVRTVVEKLDTWAGIMGRDKQAKGLRDGLSDGADMVEVERQAMKEIFESAEFAA